MIFDTHAHYDDEKFDEDREQVLTSLESMGIGTVVNVGASLESTKGSFELAKKYPFIYFAAGVHPDNAKELDEDNFQWLGDMADDAKCVAIGEIGLDYYWDNSPRDVQLTWFKRQLALAVNKNKAIIIHSREACEDTLEVLKTFHAENPGHPPVVIHCFSYSPEIAAEYIKMGFYIGIGGVVTFKNGKKMKETVDITPLDLILLETDCPYLAPEPNRGKRNYSGYLHEVVKTVADIKGVTIEEIIEITENNAKRFYGL